MQQHKIDQTGIYIFPCGGTYVGGWYKNQESGRGTWTHPLGARYVGEFKDGGFHGRGTLTSGDGFQYVGEFKDCDFDGQGTLTFPSGDQQVGLWHEGEFVNGLYLDAEGETEFVCIDGSICAPRQNNVCDLDPVRARQKKK